MIDPDEPRRGHRGAASALAAVIENGPSTAMDVSEFLWPGGKTLSRAQQSRDITGYRGNTDAGRATNKRRPHLAAGKKLTDLARADLVTATNDRPTLWTLRPDCGRVWVIYVATRRVLAGVYNANVLVEKGTDQMFPRIWDGNVVIRDGLVDIRLPGVSETERLDALLDIGVRALAIAVLNSRPEFRVASGVGVGLPVDMTPSGKSVSAFNSQRWNHSVSIAHELQDKWRDQQRTARDLGHTLPDLPAGPDQEPLVCTDSDVTFDTLAAMYPSMSGRLTDRLGKAKVVLGVKYTGGIRSTVITRGPSLFGLKTDRSAGERRDSVYRGANGATNGLGHTVALTRSAATVRSERFPGFLNAIDFAAELHKRRQACSCGELELTHLDSLVSAPRLADRLGLSEEGSDLHQFWRDAERNSELNSDAGRRTRLVLEETGRLVGHALDLAARLYDPSAVFVTGTLPYNPYIWDSLRTTFERASPANGPKREICRARDIEGPAAEADPIGPRGAAWLALDTFLYPSLLERAPTLVAATRP